MKKEEDLVNVSDDDNREYSNGNRLSKKEISDKFQKMSNKLIDIMSHSIGEDEELEHQPMVDSEQ